MVARLTARFTLGFLIRVIRFIRGQRLLRFSPRLLIGALEIGPLEFIKRLYPGIRFCCQLSLCVLRASAF